MALTDDVTVLRDGRTVLHAETAGLEPQAIAAAIAGRSVTALERPAVARTPGAPVLELRDLASPGKLAPTSLTLRAGEVLGLAGTLGSGRSELLHALFGADPRSEEHTSELQSLMRISYAVFCLQNKITHEPQI